MKSLPMIWHHVVNVKYTVKILSICVAFLETWTLTTQCIYILFSLCEVEGEIWRVLLKGNSWYSVLWYWKNTFWSSFQCSHDFRRIWCRNFGSYSGSSEPLSFFFKGFITNKLTRIFVSFRVIHFLLSLILSTE